MVCEMWSAVAADWDRLGERVETMKTDVTERLLAAAGPLDGRRVLELGAGTGRLSERLADLVGPDGAVVASDGADGMVQVLKERLGRRSGVEVVQADALDLAFDAESFDVVLFRMGLMLASDPAAALQGIRRVLQPGGCFATAVWGPAPANPWLTTVGMAAMMHGLVPGPPPMGPGSPFSLGDPEALAALFVAAGYVDVDVAVVDSVNRLPDTAAHVDMVCALAPPLSAALGTASADQLAAVRRTVGELTAQFRDGGGVAVPMQAVVARGRM